MKKALSILLSVLLLAACVPLGALPVLSVSAATSGTTGDCSWRLVDDDHLIISGNGAMGNYAWNAPAPWGDSITSVTIREGVTSIGDSAFYACVILESVTIPNSVTTIGQGAFEACCSLESVTIPSSVTSIKKFAFVNCDLLTSIAIPDSVTTIGESAFECCYSLESVTIGDSVTSIGQGVFAGCTALPSVNIPSSVTSIGWGAFNSCDSLTSITVAADNPNYCSVNGVLFNKSKTTLMQYPAAKSGSYTIPNGVTTIEREAFYECASLTAVTIPHSVTTIKEDAFCYCGALSDVYYKGDAEDQEQMDIAYGNNDLLYATWHYSSTTGDCTWTLDGVGHLTISGNGAMEDYTYSKAAPWGTYISSVTIEDGVTSIGNLAFVNCDLLTSIAIPDSVTTIGESAFECCYSLESVTIGDSVTTIGESAFECCYSLKSVNIPDSVTSIGEGAFGYCSSLTSITVAADNPNYCSADNVLFDKAKTTLIKYPAAKSGSYTIPNGVTTIEREAFYECASLTAVTIPHSVTTIKEDAFCYCGALSDVYYKGDAEDQEQMDIAYGNDDLLYATWHYAKCDHVYDDANDIDCNECGAVRQIAAQVLTYGGSSISEDVNGLAFRFDANVVGVQVENGNEYVTGSATVSPYVGGESYKVVRMGAIVSNFGEAILDIQHADGMRVVNIEAVRLCDWSADTASFAVRLINIPENGKDMEIFARPYYVYEVDGEEIVVYGDAVSQIYNEVAK